MPPKRQQRRVTLTLSLGQPSRPSITPAEFGHSAREAHPIQQLLQTSTALRTCLAANQAGHHATASLSVCDCQIGGPASLTRPQADQNQPRGAGGSACPITKSTYSPVLFPSKWCSSYLPETGAAVHGSNSLGPSNSIGSCQSDQLSTKAA